MHFLRLFALASALTAASGAPSSQRDISDLQARSTHELDARKPLNAFHAPHRFADSAGKRAFKKHRRGPESFPQPDRSQKRKVRKRSGKCVAKTSTASLSAATSASDSAAPSGTAVTLSSSVQSTGSSVQASSYSAPSSTLNVQNGSVLSSTVTTSSSATQFLTPASPAATSTTSTSAAPATTSSASSWTSVDPDGNGPFNGEITYYNLGSDGSAIGACGTNLVDSDKVGPLVSSPLRYARSGLTGFPIVDCGSSG